jgi:hypothetical protein
VRRNNGGPGIDKMTLAGVEEYGIIRLLDELACELKEGGLGGPLATDSCWAVTWNSRAPYRSIGGSWDIHARGSKPVLDEPRQHRVGAAGSMVHSFTS